MRREEALDALGQVETMGARVRPMGRWYAVYGLGFGLTSMTLLLIMGITDSLIGVLVGLGFYLVALTALSVYAHVQPVKPLGYAKLHRWGIALWTAVYVTAVLLGSFLFQGELLWWVPMAVLSAIPTSVAGITVLRRSGSAQ